MWEYLEKNWNSKRMRPVKFLSNYKSTIKIVNSTEISAINWLIKWIYCINKTEYRA